MSQTTRDLLNARAPNAELTETQRHRLLASPRRRHALAAVADHEEPIDLENLAARVAEREGAVAATDADVEMTLHHIHLPKLADAGVLEYDPSANRIVP